MYIIHDKTENTTAHYEGNWPVEYLEKMLNKEHRIIVVSLYSNTIKVPYKLEYNGIVQWEWENFPLLK